jgi:hypothetical protein
MSDTSNAPSSPPAKEEDKRKRGAAIWWWGGAALVAAIIAGLYFGHFLGGGKVRVQKQSVQNAYLFPVDGMDGQGRRASFDFIIFTKDYTWVKGSTSQVERSGSGVPETDTVREVVSSQIRETLLREKELIAVGLASREGERQAEEDRAARRSQTAAGWLTSIAGPSTPIWRLNLGQYGKDCASQEDADTSFERPLILAGVRSKDEGTNLREALANAISGKENLPSRECYSQFELTRARD